ncbi:MAG: hypothetical protein ACI9KS_001961, partial [Sulfitobacter sp.]
EATKFFGKPSATVIKGLDVQLRTPVDVRADYTARHAELLRKLS